MKKNEMWFLVILILVIIAIGAVLVYTNKTKDGFVTYEGVIDPNPMPYDIDYVNSVANDIEIITDEGLINQPNFDMGPQAVGSSRITTGGW